MDDKKSESHIESTKMSQFNLPVILRGIKQAQKQSNTNKSLFKEDTLSSISQNQQENIIIKKNPFNSLNNNYAQAEELRKFMKKADDLNRDNIRKLQQQSYVKEFPKYQRSSGSLYKINDGLLFQNNQQRQRDKQLRKAYLPKGLKNVKKLKPRKIYQSKPTNATKEVQTERQYQPEIKKQVKNSLSSKSPNMYVSIDAKPRNNRINIKDTIKNDNEQQVKIPQKRVGKFKFNNRQINQSYQPKISSTVYLQTLSHRNHNFKEEVKRYSKINYKQQIQLATCFNTKNYESNDQPIIPLKDVFSRQSSSDFKFQKKQKEEDQRDKNIIKNINARKQTQSAMNQTINFQQTGQSNLFNTIIGQVNKQQQEFSLHVQKNSQIRKMSQHSGTDFYKTPKTNKFHPNTIKQDLNQKESFVQVPSVHELKIGKNNQNDVHQRAHQIKNDFSDNDIDWIMSKFKPKSDIIKRIDTQKFQIKKYRNGVYFGQVNEDGLKNSKGVIFYYNGRIFEGTFINDLKEGKGYQGFPDGSHYIGEFKKGIKQGKGRFQWANGQVYDGQWENGKKSGSGMWKSPDGQTYIGEWKNGKVQGFGVYTMASGSRYQGEFYNSLKHGLGTQRYENGDNYVGSFHKNRPNGNGQFFWSNGNYYKGRFVNGLRHGQGFFKDQNNHMTYIGQFRNDKICGKGEMTYQNGEKYIGNFQNNLRHGFGQIYRQSYCIFSGYWVNDEMVDQKGIPIIYEQVQRQQSIANLDNKKKLKKKSKSPFNNKPLEKSTSSKKNSLKKKSKDLKAERNSMCFKRECGCSKKH